MIVETAAGKVQGFAPLQSGAGDQEAVLQFRGIPYATADRFRPPRSPAPWPGIRDATAFGPVPPQNISPTDLLLGLEAETTDEDCLVLNVYTPAADGARRPVLVWIHGGGFTNGCGHVPHYEASNLVRVNRGEVVVVTINYRLGALGFLHLDEVLPDWAGSGVNGLRDQIAALRWVRDNIAAFGGDPDQVTIFGESAGGMSVAALMGTPDASGLFHRAIAQSGAADRLLPAHAAAWVTEQLLHHLDLRPDQAPELLRLPVDQLLAAQTEIETGRFLRPSGPDHPGPAYLQLPFQPVIDGTVVPRSPLEAVRDGSAAGIPLVTGTTRDEWRLFMVNDLDHDIGEDRLRIRAARLVAEDDVDDVIATYREARPDDRATELWCAMVTDYVFRIPAIRLAEAQAGTGAPVAMYRFDHPSTAMGGLPGACHAIDVPFVFANVDLPGIAMLLGDVDDGTRRLAQRCARAWGTVAATGSPAHEDLPWPAYDRDRRATCILDREVTTIDDPESPIRELWARLVPVHVDSPTRGGT